MSELAIFANHIQEVLQDANREPTWNPKEIEEYMALVGQRRQQLEAIAQHLHRDIVNPRLKMVARLFPNADLPEEQPLNGTLCLFNYCDRFPAITELEFTIEHDVRFNKLFVHTRIHIVPSFMRFIEEDKLPLMMDSVDDEDVADWVEERLLEFLDTYMRIDSNSDDLIKNTAIDPVCGMNILCSTAATGSYCGHQYYFCSEDCLAKFQVDPTQYVQIKTL